MGGRGKFVTLAVLWLATGCVHQHRDPAPAEVPLDVQAALAMPQPAKNRVHVVFVGGAVDFAGLGHLRKEIIDLGFIKTYAGQVGQKHGFKWAFEETRGKGFVFDVETAAERIGGLWCPHDPHRVDGRLDRLQLRRA